MNENQYEFGKNAKKRPRIRSKTFFYFPNV